MRYAKIGATQSIKIAKHHLTKKPTNIITAMDAEMSKRCWHSHPQKHQLYQRNTNYQKKHQLIHQLTLSADMGCPRG